jgi:hypothetical protein
MRGSESVGEPDFAHDGFERDGGGRTFSDRPPGPVAKSSTIIAIRLSGPFGSLRFPFFKTRFTKDPQSARREIFYDPSGRSAFCLAGFCPPGIDCFSVISVTLW